MEHNTSSMEIAECDIFSIHAEMPRWEAIITIISLSTFLVITIIGNIFVIFSVCTYRPLKVPQNFFLVSLAVADLTVAVIVMPINIIASVKKDWILGPGMCQVWLLCDVLCCTASILNLCAIALDRYWAATDRYYRRTLKRVVIMALVVWIVSAIISSPLLYFWNVSNKSTTCTVCCLPTFWAYIIYSASGSFYIPLLIMLIINTKIFLATKKRHRKRIKSANEALNRPKTKQHGDNTDKQCETESEGSPLNDKALPETGERRSRVSFVELVKLRNPSALAELPRDSEDQGVSEEAKSLTKNSVTSKKTLKSVLTTSFLSKTLSRKSKDLKESPTKTIVLENVERKRRISLSKERKSARALGVVMGVFVVCWLPFFLMYVILPFNKHLKLPPRIVNLITWLGYVNSALDPFIYTIFNLDFRKALKKMLRIKS